MDTIIFFILITNAVRCYGVTELEQLEHIIKRRQESEGLNQLDSSAVSLSSPFRRAGFQYDPHEVSAIIGVPSMPNHLPEAEPILPGHTLVRPSMGMLKSAVKFPHKDMEYGAGVYGNIDNLGLRYDSKNERVLYSGFRRMPAEYIMVVPNNVKDKAFKTGFSLSSTVLDLDKKEIARKQLLKKLRHLKMPVDKELKVYFLNFPKKSSYATGFFSRGKSGKFRGHSSEKSSFYLNSGDSGVSANHLRFKRSIWVHDARNETKKAYKKVKKFLTKLFENFAEKFKNLG